jgi:GNAT superfamily N-acetyltransferase
MELLRSSDLGLARRLEAAEAANAFSLARAAGFETEAIAGGCAVFAGLDSPMTHALGCGLSGPVNAGEIERLEEFFFARGSDCLIDLCPMADSGLVQAVMDRGYSIIEFNNLMVRRLSTADGEWNCGSFQLELVVETTRKEWLELVAESFEAPLEVLENIPVYGDVLMAHLGGKPAAAAGMSSEAGVALLSGDATLPVSRGLGLQGVLIRERIARAARAGCDLAMACVLPGSGSHRNYERAGFQLVYMRVNVKRPRPQAGVTAGDGR